MRRHSKGTETKPDVRNAAGTAFVFVPRFVCPGDILLTRVPFDLLDPSTYAGVAIRGATLAPFSHAALCIEPGLMIEAIGTGVCRLALGQTGSRQRRNVKLLRLTLDVPDGHIIAQKASILWSSIFIARLFNSGRNRYSHCGAPERKSWRLVLFRTCCPGLPRSRIFAVAR